MEIKRIAKNKVKRGDRIFKYVHNKKEDVDIFPKFNFSNTKIYTTVFGLDVDMKHTATNSSILKFLNSEKEKKK